MEVRATKVMNTQLQESYTGKGVLHALQEMDPTKVSGPDVISPAFNQKKFWSVVKNKVIIFVLGVLNYRMPTT